MSFTYATLKTAIGDYLESAETTFTNNLPTFIKEAEDRILKYKDVYICKGRNKNIIKDQPYKLKNKTVNG